jgi:hypothetical protein
VSVSQLEVLHKLRTWDIGVHFELVHDLLHDVAFALVVFVFFVVIVVIVVMVMVVIMGVIMSTVANVVVMLRQFRFNDNGRMGGGTITIAQIDSIL